MWRPNRTGWVCLEWVRGGGSRGSAHLHLQRNERARPAASPVTVSHLFLVGGRGFGRAQPAGSLVPVSSPEVTPQFPAAQDRAGAGLRVSGGGGGRGTAGSLGSDGTVGLSAQRWPPQEPSFSPGSSGSQREGPQRERPQPPGSRCHFPCVLLAGRVTSLGEGGLTRLPRDRAPSWRSRRRRPRVVPHAGHLPSGQFRSLKAGTVTSPTAAASRECNSAHRQFRIF